MGTPSTSSSSMMTDVGAAVEAAVADRGTPSTSSSSTVMAEVAGAVVVVAVVEVAVSGIPSTSSSLSYDPVSNVPCEVSTAVTGVDVDVPVDVADVVDGVVDVMVGFPKGGFPSKISSRSVVK